MSKCVGEIPVLPIGVFTFLGSALFWDITQRRGIIPHRCFGTTYGSHRPRSRSPRRRSDFLTLEDGTGRLSRTSARNYHCTLRIIPEERRFHLHRGRSLQSRILLFYCIWLWTLMYSLRVFENSAKENIWNSGSDLYCRGVIICGFHVVLVPNPAETEWKTFSMQFTSDFRKDISFEILQSSPVCHSSKSSM
jgi:hypothetical protein